jgi:hypothetical protein
MRRYRDQLLRASVCRGVFAVTEAAERRLKLARGKDVWMSVVHPEIDMLTAKVYTQNPQKPDSRE